MGVDVGSYLSRVPSTPWGTKYTDEYRIVMRKMLNLSGERTLIPAIIPKRAGHIDGIFGIANRENLLFWEACLASLPYDFLIKASGKSNCRNDLMSKILFPDNKIIIASEMECRALLLNSLDIRYSELWNHSFKDQYRKYRWSKEDERLSNSRFTELTNEWKSTYPFRTDFERRQALVEIDVLVAMALGMKLEQLKTIYRLQFPVLQSNEGDTWYDTTGRIVFTCNRALTGVGFERKEWEYGIKDAHRGQKYYRTIVDDTMPEGPIERTIEYIAPFDRCDREQDYETAWKFFEEKYGKSE